MRPGKIQVCAAPLSNQQDADAGFIMASIEIMIPQDLLDILACPLCKTPLTLGPNGESLKCGSCHRVYPVRDNIPILLVDEATLENS